MYNVCHSSSEGSIQLYNIIIVCNCYCVIRFYIIMVQCLSDLYSYELNRRLVIQLYYYR